MKNVRHEPTAQHPFFLWDPEGEGLTFYPTVEERDAAAEVALASCLADGEWWEDTGSICAGCVTHRAQKVDLARREDVDLDEEDIDGEGRYWPPGIDEMCNYKLMPIAAPEEKPPEPIPGEPMVKPENILLHVDLFRPEGKWSYGFEVEIPNRPFVPSWETLSEIDRLQNAVLPGTVISGQYMVIIRDDPEQKRNPQGQFFFNRMYTNRQVIAAMLSAPGKESKS